MNDSELESKLKSVRVPERADDYWEDFPSQVRARAQLPSAAMAIPRREHLSGLTWAGGFAMSCAICALMILPSFQMAIRDSRALHRELAALPHHLHILMADEHGMHYLIADQN